MIWTTVSDDQLFVWWNGQLVFKRWIGTGSNAVFDLHHTFRFWDEDMEVGQPGTTRQEVMRIGNHKAVDEGVEVDESLNTVSRTNDEGFARLIKLYARPGDVIADPTFGNGVFWHRVDRTQYSVFATDLARDDVDLRSLPYADESLDVLICDPPYRYTPTKNVKQEDTPGHGKVDGLYNLQAARLTSTKAVLDLYFDGMKEGARVLRNGGFLIVKCQDTVQDGKNIWVHNVLMAKAEELGYACRDLLIVVPPAVLKTRWDKQRHLRKAHSYFLVFRKGGHFPFGIPSVCRR